MSMTQYLSTITQFNPNRLFPDNLIIFVASTTGQGDVPDNMKVTMYIINSISLWFSNSLQMTLFDDSSKFRISGNYYYVAI